MSKYSDGFSDNSYEELLNQYAGESLGSKSSRTSGEDIKASAASKKPGKTPSYEEPVFNIDTRRKTKPKVDKSFDIEFIAPFEETVKKPQPVIEKRYEEPRRTRRTNTASNSNTMEFSAKKTPPKNKAAVSSAKSIISGKHKKSKSKNIDYTSNAESTPKTVSKSTSYPRIFVKRNGKTKIDLNALKYTVIKSYKEHKQAFIVFGCCVLISVILASIGLSCINDILAINRDNEETIEVILPNDADTFDAVRALDKAGLIKNSLFCNLFLKVMGYSNENYLPGVYYFTEDMGVEKMITRFKTSTTRGAHISVTIPEGYTIDQIFERLEKNDICTKEALYKTIDNVDFSSEYDFIKNLDEVEDRYHVLEGYMFPATYEFEQGADPATVIRKFLDAFRSRWTDEYSKRAEELSMSVDDIITIASIIEKEGANSQQFSQISSVLHNRLNRSGLYPTLDCDSTKDYVTNTIAKRITTASELNPYIVNYSTYESAGLPPGAICNPGTAAIEAALNPDANQYYFFAHDKNKKIYLASTIEEHNANLRKINKVNAEEN